MKKYCNFYISQNLYVRIVVLTTNNLVPKLCSGISSSYMAITQPYSICKRIQGKKYTLTYIKYFLAMVQALKCFK